jgi:hypothetical protein
MRSSNDTTNSPRPRRPRPPAAMAKRTAPRPRRAPGTTMRKRTAFRVGAAAVAAGALAATAALTLTGSPSASTHHAMMTSASVTTRDASAQGGAAYSFRTLNNANDPTFNQLLGINDNGHIAGYFGSGAAGHPNKGYLLRPPYGSQGQYQNINFPGSVQTQLTGLNDAGVQVGFWSTQNTASMTNNNFGFYLRNGHFHEVNFPTGDPASPPVDQLLGVNDQDVAVGFFTNGQGDNRGYEYNIISHGFSRVLQPGHPGASLTAAAINNRGDVAGFYTTTAGVTDAFLKYSYGRFVTLAVPGASMTQAFGVNDRDEVVGTYTDGTGNSATTHGFTWRPGHGFSTVDDPHGVGTTTINGVNDRGDLVGFYTDAAGNTDGMLALPRH